ncbi:MAG: hypothetical protein CMH83_21050 [Nocardioides sp.]|nr:hypothetical protein [Nocardioides sp.]
MIEVPLPTPEQVAVYLDWPLTTDQDGDPVAEDAGLIATHLNMVTAMVRSYTREVPFTAEGDTGATVPNVVATVIISATARSVSNPAHSKRTEVGSFSEAPAAFTGFTLAEQTVLNSYRRRTA